jgi:hypothetical protein
VAAEHGTRVDAKEARSSGGHGTRHIASPLLSLPRRNERGRQVASAFASDEEELRSLTELLLHEGESAPRGAVCPGGVRGPARGRRNGREKLEGSTDVGGAASGGRRSSTIEQRSAASGPRAVARQKGVGKPIPVAEAPILVTGPETGGYGLSGRSVLVLAEGRLVRSPIAGGEAACRVAVARGDAPGVQLGADPVDRRMSERGKRPGGARRAREGMGQAHRPPLPPGRGGGPVVVVGVTPHRGGRESRPQGEGVQ